MSSVRLVMRNSGVSDLPSLFEIESALRELFEELSLTYRVRQVGEELRNPVVVADIDEASFIARITVWAKGSCDLERYDLDCDDPELHFEHLEFSNIDDVRSAVVKLVS